MKAKAAFYAGFLSCALLVVAALILIHESRGADWAVATVGSQHLGGGDFCESNPGLGIESGDLSSRALAGFYRNSLCGRWSFYAGRSWLPFSIRELRIGAAGMVITGYESAVTVGAAMVISYEREKHGFNIVWFPDKRGDLLQGVIAIQLKRKW